MHAHLHTQTHLKNPITDAIYVGTCWAFQSSICLATGNSDRKLFYHFGPASFYNRPNQYLQFYAYCTNLSQAHPNLSDATILQAAGCVQIWSSHADTLMFVFVQKAQTLANNESLCCVHSTTCRAAFGCGSDGTQNESLVRVGQPFDGHKTAQLPQRVGCYKNTP